ncbi:integrase core domain-containing protein [Thermovorax subterraneus]|nr:integrase core domain-containing protein [Thermovorax subterraneus]
MVWEATEWQIIPPAGGSASDIKIVSSPDMKTRTAGDYKVRVRVKNSTGHYSEWYERTLSIAPNLPPVANFFVIATVLRDPQNGNKAKVELIDSSYSPDGDYIAQRIWRYKYDSNNNGSLSKEFQEFCKRLGIIHERIPVRSPERNPNIERFFRTLKEEFVEINDFIGYGSFIKGLDKFMMEYNTVRPHQSLRYMTPTKFYEEILRNNVSRGVLVI